MKERYEKIGVIGQFAFGILAALVFDLLIKGHFILGIVSGGFVSLVALYLSSDDVRNEVAALKTVPHGIGLAAAEIGGETKSFSGNVYSEFALAKIFVHERMTKVVRMMRQKNLLRRNRAYRTRKLLSA